MLWFVVSFVVAAEPSEAQLQKQCEAKKASACRELGLALAADKKADLRPAYAAYSRGCQLQDTASCNFAGVLLMDGVGLARDTVEAERLFHLACEKDSSAACLNEAQLINSQGKDPTKQIKRAFDLSKAGCDAGEQSACRDMLRASDASPKSILAPEEVVRVATRSCNLGADWACGTLALAYLSGYGIKADAAEAKRLANSACAKNDRNGCEVMSLIAFKASEWAEALRTATIACDGRHPLACYAKGAVLMGKGSLAPDYPKASEALEQSCFQGYGEACVTLFAFASKLKVEGDKLKRVEERSCRADRPAACKKVLERSEPPPELLEFALDSVCKNTSGPFSEPKAGAEACEKLAGLREARGESNVTTLYATSCRVGRQTACEKVAAAADAKGTERLDALKVLCGPGARQWCAPLLKEYERTPPADASDQNHPPGAGLHACQWPRVRATRDRREVAVARPRLRAARARRALLSAIPLGVSRGREHRGRRVGVGRQALRFG
ncbi:MAG: tetratricopeptide repeat protein [Archangium sp.]